MLGAAFFCSNRPKSAEERFVALSASTVCLATDVEGVDFRGQVPYHELLALTWIHGQYTGSRDSLAVSWN